MLEKMERVSTAKTALVRRTRNKAEKRRIVEETQREGASVRSVARAYDIPANQLFHWRKLYREGLLGTEAEAATGSGLVAVRVVGEQQPMAKQERPKQADHLVISSGVGTIQIETGKGRLIVEGAADPATLRVVLERLLG
jgi:transposase